MYQWRITWVASGGVCETVVTCSLSDINNNSSYIFRHVLDKGVSMPDPRNIVKIEKIAFTIVNMGKSF